MEEAGYKDFVFATDMVLLAPAKTPPDDIKWLEAETLKVLSTPEMKDKLYQAGFLVRPKGADAAWARVTKEITSSSKLSTRPGSQSSEYATGSVDFMRAPPSTGSATPVMKLASSEARNSAAFATSQAFPILWRSGTRDAQHVFEHAVDLARLDGLVPIGEQQLSALEASLIACSLCAVPVGVALPTTGIWRSCSSAAARSSPIQAFGAPRIVPAGSPPRKAPHDVRRRSRGARPRARRRRSSRAG